MVLRPLLGVVETAPEEGMHTPLRYEVLEQVVSVITVCRPLVELIKHKDRDLACQLRRALSSAGLNVAEAFGNSSGNARLRFLAAKGSLYEAQAAIQMAVAWGYFRNEQSAAALCAIDKLAGRVYGLARN